MKFHLKDHPWDWQKVVLIARPNNIEISVCVRKWVVLITESNCESVKTSDYIVDLQNKNNKNDRWLFIVTLQQSIRLKVFSSLVKIYSLSFTLKLHKNICWDNCSHQEGKSHFLNGTSDFYQKSSPGQVVEK